MVVIRLDSDQLLKDNLLYTFILLEMFINFKNCPNSSKHLCADASVMVVQQTAWATVAAKLQLCVSVGVGHEHTGHLPN